MPSKKLTLLLVVLTVAGIYGLAILDRTRPVPWFPPQLAKMLGGPASVAAAAPIEAPPPLVAPRGGSGGHGTGAPKPEVPKPEVPKPEVPPPTDKPPVDPAGAFSLVPIEASATVSPRKGESNVVAVLKIGADGKTLRWAGFDAGSWPMVNELMTTAAENPDFQLVIAPDKNAPWQCVIWAMEMARKAGIYDVGIGVTAMTGSSADPEMKMYNAPQPKGEYVDNPDLPEIKVVVSIGADGKPAWSVEAQGDAKKATKRQELFEAVGGLNSEYAEMSEDGDYARNATKTPWVVIAPPETPCRDVIQTLGAVRMAAIYTVRFGGEFPPNPGFAK